MSTYVRAAQLSGTALTMIVQLMPTLEDRRDKGEKFQSSAPGAPGVALRAGTMYHHRRELPSISRVYTRRALLKEEESMIPHNPSFSSRVYCQDESSEKAIIRTLKGICGMGRLGFCGFSYFLAMGNFECTGMSSNLEKLVRDQTGFKELRQALGRSCIYQASMNYISTRSGHLEHLSFKHSTTTLGTGHLLDIIVRGQIGYQYSPRSAQLGPAHRAAVPRVGRGLVASFTHSAIPLIFEMNLTSLPELLLIPGVLEKRKIPKDATTAYAPTILPIPIISLHRCTCTQPLGCQGPKSHT
ncbi:hypothetical protein M011DRAFT_505668 [Sporormia fimetaria CBS 119925]|uniref:Uncharacterized protein n=1 Tax=Sporormia fimetaria CBS 119925 TaxID=1340428 RepID=A0A6A6V396_9PLEO|nr:hypothetical protein M011DRAFT_505668 [Sporormia fimetaria CBS 119925]